MGRVTHEEMAAELADIDERVRATGIPPAPLCRLAAP
jgi:hypothetical protein